MTDNPDSAPTHDPRPPTVWEFIRRNPATTALIAASIAVACWTRLGDSLEKVRWLTFVDLQTAAVGASTLPGLADGQAWRLVTPILIHFGIVHLVFNMMWLYDLGGMIEGRWRSRHFVCLVAAIAIIANAAQFSVNWDFQHGVRTANVLSGGMSGVVYGLFGYLWVRGRREPSLGMRFNQQTVVLMLGWLVFCMTGMMGYVGNMAHLTGLIVGMAAGLIASRAVR